MTRLFEAAYPFADDVAELVLMTHGCAEGQGAGRPRGTAYTVRRNSSVSTSPCRSSA